MRRTATTLTLALALLVTACSSADSPEQATIGTAPPLITTSSVAPTTTVPLLPRGPGAVVTSTGVVAPVLSETAGGWTITTPCNRPATISASAGRHVREAMIVLDPGHGGSDPGAVSPGGALRESPVNLAVSNHTRVALEEAGVSVLLTRTADYDMELMPRAEIAKAVNARAFVSIHHNAEPDTSWPRPGSETYYQIGSADSKRLAGLIYEEIVRALTPFNVAWVADTDAGAKYRPGSRGDYYAALRQPAPVVAVLAELAFISNPAEATLLARPDVQEVEGRAVARGILRYLNTLDAGSGFTEPYPRPTPPPRTGPVTPAPCTDPSLQL